MISIALRASRGLALFSAVALAGSAMASNPPVPIAGTASILPEGRSVVYGTPATVFASFVNTSATDLDGAIARVSEQYRSRRKGYREISV